MRKLRILIVFALLATACSHRATADRVSKPQRTDEAGHVIPSGQNWSGAGVMNDAARTWLKNNAKTAYAVAKCGVPPTPSPEQKKAYPPGYDPDSGLTKPKNDFPITATISRTAGDPGTPVTVKATAVGQPEALIVVLGRFFDRQNHGMQGAKVADLTGRATLRGPIPKDAPVGLANIVVSASTHDHRSALILLKFRVTGPGCR